MPVRFSFIMVACFASLASPALGDEQKPVSFHREIKPILNANCNACHKPDKSKGDLDMTTFASLMKGGKNGSPVEAGKPEKSLLFDMIHGEEPEMPSEGDPLKPEQVALIERWIKQGAKDDTPAPGSTKVEPPVYMAPPVITSLAFSPDGSLLAVSGYHEVLLHKSDGSGIVARLTGEAPRIESLAFTKDGKYLGVAGGSPGEFGQVQIYEVATHKAVRVLQPSTDSLYGLSFSPDGKTVAVGAADKVARLIGVEDGKVHIEFKAHADWVLGTIFSLDGKQFVTGGRDKAMKLVEVETGRFVDDINNPLEEVLCMARHPKEEQVLFGGDLGVARIYRISDNQGRTAGRNDTNLITAFERQPGPVSAAAFSPDGSQVALGTVNDVKIYDAKGKPADPKEMKGRKAQEKKSKPPKETKALLTLSGHQGPVFAVAYKPDGSVIATGGFDGTVRLYDAKTGDLVKQFVPVPIVGARSPDTRPATLPTTASAE
jgi:WD40 repeat protein/mono/diheme cytochrome c family protein